MSCFEFNYEELISDPKKFDVNILPPVTHPDPHRLFISGTGLTHTGSVKSRDMMHNDDEEKIKLIQQKCLNWAQKEENLLLEK